MPNLGCMTEVEGDWLSPKRRRSPTNRLKNPFRFSLLAQTPDNAENRAYPSFMSQTRAQTIRSVLLFVAQAEGFEPPWAFTQTVFKTASL